MTTRATARAQVESILCPVDFSPISDAALDYAVELARELGARLHILHVIPLDPVVAVAPLPSKLLASARERAAKQRAERVERCAQRGAAADAELAEGIRHVSIVQGATGHDADLIVMGTHGLSGAQRMVLGSVAERVVRTAPCPVLTRREGSNG